ncbi:MAG: hypothetical protein WEB57_00755 [Pseudohongiellaceae bacterium]
MTVDAGKCPADAMDMMGSSGEMPGDGMLHDHPCCQDAETVARTGQLCNPGQECGTGISLPAIYKPAPLPPEMNDNPPVYSPSLLSGEPDELLRPPRSLPVSF